MILVRRKRTTAYILETADTVNRLLRLCESEIDHILCCAECYEMKYKDPNEWHTFACSKPHLILWISISNAIPRDYWPPKYRGRPSRLYDVCWPAKLMSIDKTTVKVIYFGSSELVEVPAMSCSIYSTEIPLFVATVQALELIQPERKVRPIS